MFTPKRYLLFSELIFPVFEWDGSTKLHIIPPSGIQASLYLSRLPKLGVLGTENFILLQIDRSLLAISKRTVFISL